ncbi:glycosyltransferase family 9 protein [Vibrio sinaloensis]|uniref:Glycosyl transferase n=1 Tax=Photobacterium sp. (strain ATCC 43367) TaxID=379097 RepID=A0A0A5JHP6_PHOS4|nr:glycosyltransferase family 9 protein [Vibrio sinaloensis]KGY07468.1 glycosyl transferase [Vibrio sinaloensis]
MPLFNTAPKSVCFLRLSAIGDTCHAVAAIQALQKHWPDTQVTWVIGKIEARLLDGLENVELVVFDKKAGLKGMQSVWKQLKGREFDALIHMQLALRASLLTLGIKAKYKVGFNFKRAKEAQWLFTNQKISDTSSAHVLDSFFAFTEFLGVPNTKPHWQLPIAESDINFAKQTLAGKPTVVISPAASKDERNWLTSRYAELADWIIDQGYQVALCGSPSEREIKLGQAISGHMNHTPLNLIGQTSLKQLTAVLAQAQVVIAPDSGPAHIATTQGTPVIGLYGHSNPKRTGPYNDLDSVVSVYEHYIQEQQGNPADQLAWSTRVKGDHVMQSITLDMVQSKLKPLLNQH